MHILDPDTNKFTLITCSNLFKKVTLFLLIIYIDIYNILISYSNIKNFLKSSNHLRFIIIIIFHEKKIF
jgi:hypothetical protein